MNVKINQIFMNKIVDYEINNIEKENYILLQYQKLYIKKLLNQKKKQKKENNGENNQE